MIFCIITSNGRFSQITSYWVTATNKALLALWFKSLILKYMVILIIDTLYIYHIKLGIYGSCPRSNSLMGTAWKWTHLYLHLRIHVRSFNILHVIQRSWFTSLGWPLFSWQKSRLLVFIPNFFENVIQFFTSGPQPLPATTCPIKRLDSIELDTPFSLKLMSSLMSDLFDWNN